MINNNILAALVVVAILISVVGTSLVFMSNYGNIRGYATGITNLDIESETTLTMVRSTVSFGTLSLGGTEDTTDNNPAPFLMRNDGSVLVRITVEATDLFIKAPNPSSNYQFMCGGTLEVPICPLGSALVWTNMPTTGSLVPLISRLGFADDHDEIEAEISVTVPGDEPAGSKTSIVTFTATEAI